MFSQNIVDRIKKKLLAARQFEILLPPFSEATDKEIRALSAKMIADMFPECPTQAIDYDGHSAYIAIRCPEGHIIGIARLILNTESKKDVSFQVEEYPEKLLGCAYKAIPQNQIAEISRIFVNPAYREQGGFLALLKATFMLCEKQGITHLFSMVDPELDKKYQQYGLHYTPCCEAFDISYTKKGLFEAIYFTEIEQLLADIPDPELKEFLNAKTSCHRDKAACCF